MTSYGNGKNMGKMQTTIVEIWGFVQKSIRKSKFSKNN